jgi:hypothetical protein
VAPSRDTWASAFHRQARSDHQIYELLAATPGIPRCHALHYLQMTCEKLAKAYRLRDTEGDVDTLTASHGGFLKFMRAWLYSPSVRRSYVGRDAMFLTISKKVLALAREIERLAPAIDRETTPANTEYPWADGESAVVPCEYAFPRVSLLTDSAGWSFLKFIALAINDF